jgi:hypothetical protein
MLGAILAQSAPVPTKATACEIGVAPPIELVAQNCGWRCLADIGGTVGPLASGATTFRNARDIASSGDMSDLANDPERPLTLRQAAQVRDDFAMIMDELDFLKAQIARLPTRRDQAFTPLTIVIATAFGAAALVILWFELFWRYCL